MALVFWDARPIIFIDYLEKGKTINGDYYIAFLSRLKIEIAKKRPDMSKKRQPIKDQEKTIWQPWQQW